MKDRILQTLQELRRYALNQPCEVAFFYHEEDSYLIRFANSAISLNTNEHLIRLEITAYSGKKRASYEMITDLDKIDEMKQGIELAVQMVEHSQPLDYQPTIPLFSETFIDESGYDPALGQISNAQRLDYFNQAVAGLESDEIRLSGIFSSGSNVIAMVNTRSEHVQYFKTSDAQVTVVLSHERLKWEVIAEQSAQNISELEPARLRNELTFLIERYQNDAPQQLPLGRYDIIFGQAATADMLTFMNWIGFNGGLMKRGFSFMSEEKVGEKVLSDKFTLIDDPARLETFPFKRDFTGLVRESHPLFKAGVFQGFAWSQDDADEFSVQATGHTVSHKSLALVGGDRRVSTLQELVGMPREKDLLYIPFLHYMNIVNPTKGTITASSRFGALLLKQDGTVAIPYNVRLTQSLLDIFGDRVAWLSEACVPYNTSLSYGARNPTAVIVPAFMQVNDLEISHSNSSY
ncbi:MAG TPA: metallopeptidase TldD-related protein [Anaerolineales bacterium]|nr:metallopeptidase TldD-related protein [Anaerolineales bacterium]